MKKRNPKPVAKRITFYKIHKALKRPFIIVKHARERMNERNFTTSDISNILKHGKKLDRHDTGKLGDPTCRVIGQKINGEWGAVAIAINPKGIIIIVTVMDNDRQVN